MPSLQDIRQRHGARSEALVRAEVERVAGVDSLATRMMADHLGTGGKRLRALLPVWVAASGGGNVERALPLGAGLELMHNATLVHDDLQDGDTHRRGKATVWKRYGANQAINAGDALYFAGMALVARADSEAGVGRAMAERACYGMQRVIEGQVMEFQLQLARDHEDALPPSLAAWERMARGKTGALFGLCVSAGAACVDGARDATLDAAASWGEDLGLLFQVQDDYLDLVGDKGRDMRGTDLAEGKLSFPVVWALEHGAPGLAEELEALVRRPRAETSAADVTRGLALLDQAGALEATAQWLRDARDRSSGSAWARAAPGLAERFLEPVAHAI